MNFTPPTQRARASALSGNILVPNYDWLRYRNETKRRAKLDRYQEVWNEVNNRHPGRPKLGQIDRLINLVCEITEMPRGKIMSPNRQRMVAWTRQAIFVFIRDRWPAYSSLEIARKFNLDHSTIIFAWAKYDDRDCYDVNRIPEANRVQFRDYVNSIKSALEGR